MNDLAHFPDKTQHSLAWEALAHEIATNSQLVSESPEPTQQPGELTIIGSGIESVGFTLGDEDLIRTADAVFYCVADPATVVWLKTIRPDAYDLYVLYDDTKVRYTTYMQMTEAMLHFVRQGKKVTAIYYGHPGIFVLSTHRAIQIARREGHKAIMRPSVCALDCLCADLGVDPCHPGMQTHEATDMLIRGRIPDTSLHVVLWQVGLIGEMGFRRKGYLNNNFSVFIEYLQKHYGEDYPIVNYVASRYPTIPPSMETYPLSALHDPKIQTKVTGISTFYLAPKDKVEADHAMLTQLGLLKPGQTARPAEGPLREIGHYGVRERKAFKAFENFKVPTGYQWQEDTRASRFVIALRQDFKLRQRYEHDPASALAEPIFPGLTERERRQLVRREAGSIQIACKGTGIASPQNQAFLSALFTKSRLSSQLSRLLKSTSREDMQKAVVDWSAQIGYPIDWACLRSDIDLTARNSLFPWTGAYQTVEGRLIMLIGEGSSPKLFLDGQRVRHFTYRHGALHWKAEAEGGEQGFFKTDVNPQGQRRLVGSIWPEGDVAPAKHGLVALEGNPGTQHVSGFVGQYVHTDAAITESLQIGVEESEALGRQIRITLNGTELDCPITFSGRMLIVAGHQFTFAKPGQVEPDDWIPQNSLPTEFKGHYAVSTAGGSGLLTFLVSDEGIQVNGDVPETVDRQGGKITWTGGPSSCRAGSVNLLLDAVTLYPGLFGSVETGDGYRYKCFGKVTPPPDLRRIEPEFGLSHSAWGHLVSGVTNGGWFFWHQWEKASLASKLVNFSLAKLLP